MIALKALVYNELEWLKNFSYGPSLEYKGSMGFKLSSRRLRNCLPLLLGTWNIIFQLSRISLHWFFLSNSHENLQEKIEMRSKFFISLSTISWSPLVLTWTIPKFNHIAIISFEEFRKFPRDCSRLNLIWMDQWIRRKVAFWNLGSEFGHNFLPKWPVILVNIEWVPFRLINGRNKTPGCFTETFELRYVVHFPFFDLSVPNIVSHINNDMNMFFESISKNSIVPKIEIGRVSPSQAFGIDIIWQWNCVKLLCKTPVACLC